MPTEFYIAPTITEIHPETKEVVPYPKHGNNPAVNFGAIRLAKDGHQIVKYQSDAATLAAIRNDPEMLRIADDITLDDPINSSQAQATKNWFEIRKWPSHWLKAGPTRRELIGRAAGLALFSQRMEGEGFGDIGRRMAVHSVGWNTMFKNLPQSMKSELATARFSLKMKAFNLSATTTLREIFELASIEFQNKTLILGGTEIFPDHSYGNRETETASDDFNHVGIDANWSSPAGTRDHGMVAYSNVEIGAQGSFQFASGVWNADSFVADQWGEIDGQVQTGGAVVGVNLRCVTTGPSDNKGYYVVSDSDKWLARAVATDGSIIAVVFSDATGHHSITSGDTFAGEAEGTTIRCGSNNQGGGDNEQKASTDASHGSGSVGILCYAANDATIGRITGWAGGDMAASGPAVVVPGPLMIGGI